MCLSFLLNNAQSKRLIVKYIYIYLFIYIYNITYINTLHNITNIFLLEDHCINLCSTKWMSHAFFYVLDIGDYNCVRRLTNIPYIGHYTYVDRRSRNPSPCLRWESLQEHPEFRLIAKLSNFPDRSWSDLGNKCR